MKRPDFTELKENIFTNGDAMVLYRKLNTIKGVKGIYLNHAIRSTVDNLKPYVELMDIDKLLPKTESFEKFIEENTEINKKFSNNKTKKNSEGVEIWDVDVNDPEYYKALEDLNEKYKETLEERKKDLDEYSKFLEEPFEAYDRVIKKVDVSRIKDDDILDYDNEYPFLHFLLK